MLEKETVKLEDSLTAMIRITKENEEIDRKMEIEKIKQQAKKEVQQLEEVKNTKIIELAILKEMYENKQKEKEQKTKLANEIIKFKEKLQLEEELEEKEENSQDNPPEIRIDEINDDDLEQHSETSEPYTELLANIDNTKNLEINTGDIDMDEKPSTSGVKIQNIIMKTMDVQYDREKTIWDKRLNKFCSHNFTVPISVLSMYLGVSVIILLPGASSIPDIFQYNTSDLSIFLSFIATE